MNGLCPECGNPPEYHSFCTLCAALFRRRRPAHWRQECDRVWRRIDRRAARAAQMEATRQRQRLECEAIIAQVRALRSQDMMAAEAEAAAGLTPYQLRTYCAMAGLPPFRRPPKHTDNLPDKPRGPKRPVWSPERLALLKRVLGIDGATYDGAAAALDTSRGAIAGAVRDHFPELFGRRKRKPIRGRAIMESRP